MTHDEMIAVIQAHKEGKIIEFYVENTDQWLEWNKDSFDFISYDYRIKSEPHYRPFKNAEEVMEAIKEHGDWLKIGNNYTRIIKINSENIWNLSPCNYVEISFRTFGVAFANYTFADGTPFGIKEE